MTEEAEAQPTSRDTLDLLGHEAAERALLDAWNAGRMPHAWLITGPRGIGKATFAYRVARFVLSQQDGDSAAPGLFGDDLPPPEAASLAIDPDHPVVARVSAGGHADLRVLETNMPHPDHGRPARQILVGHVRKAVQFTTLTAAEQGWRVILVDPADALNANAQNAILKSLEEPPPKVLYLLVCNAPGRLLPTIRSRCRRLSLEPLSNEHFDVLLARHCPDLPEEDRHALARLAGGSIGDALALLGSGGLDLYRTVVKLLGTLEHPDIQGIHALGDTVSRAGQQGNDAFATVRDIMGQWLARLVMTGARAEKPAEIVPGEGRIAELFLARAPLEQWIEVWEKVTGLMARADGANLDRKQTIVSAFLTMAAMLKDGRATAR